MGFEIACLLSSYLIFLPSHTYLCVTYAASVSDFPGSPLVKNSPVNAEDTGLIPAPGRSHMLRSN